MAGKNLEENLKGKPVKKTTEEYWFEEKTTFYERTNLLFSRIVYHPSIIKAVSMFGVY